VLGVIAYVVLALLSVHEVHPDPEGSGMFLCLGFLMTMVFFVLVHFGIRSVRLAPELKQKVPEAMRRCYREARTLALAHIFLNLLSVFMVVGLWRTDRGLSIVWACTMPLLCAVFVTIAF